jgi:ABC-type sugar transport system substrate-binding protein
MKARKSLVLPAAAAQVEPAEDDLEPPGPRARDPFLAALPARADDPVDQALALECWKNNGCDTGTGGELTVAYVEPFGENVYREMSKMEFILQALTYPEIGEIIYTSSKLFTSTPGDPLADFRSAIAQGADVIVNYPDIADGYLPVFQEARAAGIPVATYAWGYVTGPGDNYSTVVGEDTCARPGLRPADQREVGRARSLMGGTPATPVRVLAEGSGGAEPGDRDVGVRHNWVRGVGGDGEPPRGSPGSEGHQPRVLAGYAGAQPAIEAAGIPIDQVWTMRTDELISVVAEELNELNLRIFYSNAAGNWQIRQADCGHDAAQGSSHRRSRSRRVQGNSVESLCVPADRPSVDHLAHPRSSSPGCIRKVRGVCETTTTNAISRDVDDSDLRPRSCLLQEPKRYGAVQAVAR